MQEVAAYERESGIPLVLLDDAIRTLPYGWVFVFQSRQYAESRDPADGVAGNAPFLITRTNELHVLGTARPLEDYLREFERSGSPHPPPPGTPVEVRVSGGSDRLERWTLARAFRSRLGCGIGAVTVYADRVLAGEAVAIAVGDWATAVELAEALNALGALARPGAAAAPESTLPTLKT